MRASRQPDEPGEPGRTTSPAGRFPAGPHAAGPGAPPAGRVIL